MDQNQLLILIICIAGAVIVLVALFVLLYVFVISKRSIKRQIRDIERKYSYLDALLIGQDSQYIHRLEIISHSNLLYVDKHETFSKRFKEIFDNDDKYAETLIRQLNTLVANNQFKNIKSLIADARKAVSILEDSVNTLNDDLYSLIRLEEDSRQTILKLKEEYRVTKQIYYTNASDLELVSDSVNKVFDKLDGVFQEHEEHIEKAEYDDADALIPTIEQVISALKKMFEELPNLCSLVIQVVPDKIEEVSSQYHDLLSQNLPLYHLSVEDKIKDFTSRNDEIKQGILDLKIIGATAKCETIIHEIDNLEVALAQEAEDKKVFNESTDALYNKVKILDDNFLKVVGLLPEVNGIYVIDEDQKAKIDELKANIDHLWSTKRSLDGFIHSATKQPYSVLRAKLTSLSEDYEKANTGLKDFKAYLYSLKMSCEEAYSIISVYYYRTKQVENTLRIINLPKISEKYSENIDTIYSLLCDIDSLLKKKPIDVASVNATVENLKNIANDLYDGIEENYRDSVLAESAIVYANRDRNHQADVNQQLSVLEQVFFEGDFEKVYEDANAIYHRSHVEENPRGKK